MKKLDIAISELKSAYDRLLDNLKETCCRVFGLPDSSAESLELLQERAQLIAHRSGDFLLDALILRFGEALSKDTWIEGLAALVMKVGPVHPRSTSVGKSRERNSTSPEGVWNHRYAPDGQTAENLRIEKHPPELGLYLSLLRANKLHIFDAKQGIWRFARPERSGDSKHLLGMWNSAHEIFKRSLTTGEPVPLSELYAEWSKPPFGLRDGVMPILALSYFLANNHEVALYIEGMADCPCLFRQLFCPLYPRVKPVGKGHQLLCNF